MASDLANEGIASFILQLCLAGAVYSRPARKLYA